MLVGIIQYWKNGAWDNEYKYIYTYDSRFNMTDAIYQNWSGTAWYTRLQYTNTYNANDKITGLSRKLFNDKGVVLSGGSIYYFGCHTLATSLNPAAQSSSLTCFPNPVNSYLTVENIGPHTRLIITDIAGQTVMTQTSESEKMIINVSQLPSGMYFLNKMKFIKK